jgi:hypothetical protein
VGLLFNRQILNWSGITPQKAKKNNWSGITPQKANIKLEREYSPKGKN